MHRKKKQTRRLVTVCLMVITLIILATIGLTLSKTVRAGRTAPKESTSQSQVQHRKSNPRKRNVPHPAQKQDKKNGEQESKKPTVGTLAE